jgi:hypothetical protein
MKASELRIGNLVGSYNKGEEDRVLAINAQNVLVEAKANKQGYTRYRPIPLTEEWLLKFGFEEFREGFDSDVYMYKKTKHSGLYWMDNLLYLNFSLGWVIDCKYIHQLQNIYFALTGDELKLEI